LQVLAALVHLIEVDLHLGRGFNIDCDGEGD
jgi:hypothetical protein